MTSTTWVVAAAALFCSLVPACSEGVGESDATDTEDAVRRCRRTTCDAGTGALDGGASSATEADSSSSDAGSATGTVTTTSSGRIGEISAANQAVLSFPPTRPSTSTLTAYAKPGGLLVLDPYLLSLESDGGRGLIGNLRAGGAEVILYINAMEVPDWQVGGEDFSRLAVFDCKSGTSCAATMPTNYFFPHYESGSLVKLSNWPETYLTDITKGSAFSQSVIDALGTWDRLGANGYFLDVLGTRLWTDVWTRMTATERTAWTAGAYDIVTRLRSAMGDGAILVANNVWNDGHAGLNGFVIEHHPYSSAPNFASYLDGSKPWHVGRRNIVIANGSTEAQSWRGVAGVTHITPQLDYAVQPLPVSSWPFVAPK